jgi:multidrug resistance efflux pump
MSSPATASTNTPAPAGSSRLVRLIVVVLVLLATAVALALVLPWFSYRMDNIVVREAAVRGVITRIGARIEGRVRHLDVEPGQRVFQGQVLLRLEDGHLQAALGRARGELDSTLREVESEKLAIEQSWKSSARKVRFAKPRVNWRRKRAFMRDSKNSSSARPRW